MPRETACAGMRWNIYLRKWDHCPSRGWCHQHDIDTGEPRKDIDEDSPFPRLGQETSRKLFAFQNDIDAVIRKHNVDYFRIEISIANNGDIYWYEEIVDFKDDGV